MHNATLAKKTSSVSTMWVDGTACYFCFNSCFIE